MTFLQQAQTIIRDAEKQLRTLIRTALEDRGYSDVAHLAEIAQSLERLAGPQHSSTEAMERDTLRSKDGRSPRKLATTKPTEKPAKYPTFKIEGDRLVKIGWSKKNKAEYVHKASFDVALSVFLRVGHAASLESFRVEDQFPIRLPDEIEVPSYQSYLVLAWLRNKGYIEKVGKDSYQWLTDEVDESMFKDIWNSTPKR